MTETKEIIQNEQQFPDRVLGLVHKIQENIGHLDPHPQVSVVIDEANERRTVWGYEEIDGTKGRDDRVVTDVYAGLNIIVNTPFLNRALSGRYAGLRDLAAYEVAESPFQEIIYGLKHPERNVSTITFKGLPEKSEIEKIVTERAAEARKNWNLTDEESEEFTKQLVAHILSQIPEITEVKGLVVVDEEKLMSFALQDLMDKGYGVGDAVVEHQLKDHGRSFHSGKKYFTERVPVVSRQAAEEHQIPTRQAPETMRVLWRPDASKSVEAKNNTVVIKRFDRFPVDGVKTASVVRRSDHRGYGGDGKFDLIIQNVPQQVYKEVVTPSGRKVEGELLRTEPADYSVHLIAGRKLINNGRHAFEFEEAGEIIVEPVNIYARNDLSNQTGQKYNLYTQEEWQVHQEELEEEFAKIENYNAQFTPIVTINLRYDEHLIIATRKEDGGFVPYMKPADDPNAKFIPYYGDFSRDLSEPMPNAKLLQQKFLRLDAYYFDPKAIDLRDEQTDGPTLREHQIAELIANQAQHMGVFTGFCYNDGGGELVYMKEEGPEGNFWELHVLDLETGDIDPAKTFHDSKQFRFVSDLNQIGEKMAIMNSSQFKGRTDGGLRPSRFNSGRSLAEELDQLLEQIHQQKRRHEPEATSLRSDKFKQIQEKSVADLLQYMTENRKSDIGQWRRGFAALLVKGSEGIYALSNLSLNLNAKNIGNIRKTLEKDLKELNRTQPNDHQELKQTYEDVLWKLDAFDLLMTAAKSETVDGFIGDDSESKLLFMQQLIDKLKQQSKLPLKEKLDELIENVLEQMTY